MQAKKSRPEAASSSYLQNSSRIDKPLPRGDRDELHFSSVSNCRDTRPMPRQARWSQFAGWLQQPRVSKSKDGLALIFATFGEPRRIDKAVTTCTALAFDLEAGHEPGSLHPEQPEALHHRLTTAGVAHVIWTTYSHKLEAPGFGWCCRYRNHSRHPI